MSIQTNTHAIDGAWEYTLTMREKGSNQRTICQYGVDGPILTTDYDALIQYANNMVQLFGKDRIYTISTVTLLGEFN